jgi:hypothetical protein
MPLDAIAGTRLPLTMARAEDLVNAAALRDENWHKSRKQLVN